MADPFTLAHADHPPAENRITQNIARFLRQVKSKSGEIFRRPGDAEPSQRRPPMLTAGDRLVDCSPKLDEEIDCVRFNALGRRDLFETGLHRIQSVVEFSQDFFVGATG